MGSLTGGKGGGSAQAAPAQAAAPASNPYMDMYLAQQAENSQREAQQSENNARLMQAPAPIQEPAVDPGMKAPQQQEQGGYDPNTQLASLLDALRNGA